jgi:hypothetical protein
MPQQEVDEKEIKIFVLEGAATRPEASSFQPSPLRAELFFNF